MAFTHLNSTRSDDILRSTETLHGNSFQTYLFWRRNTCWLDVDTTHRACVLNICYSCEHVYLYCTVYFFFAKHYMIRLFLQPCYNVCVRSQLTFTAFVCVKCVDFLCMENVVHCLQSFDPTSFRSTFEWRSSKTER